MGIGTTVCQHRCRNTCAMLSAAWQDEIKKIAYLEQMLKECDEPEMRKFVKELIYSHELLSNRITERLNVIKARAEVLDDIIESFET